jgi:hypothetical protein
MTAKELLQGKTLTEIETIENQIFNLIVGESVYGINIDTSSIPAGIKLSRTSDFTIENDVITFGNLSLELESVNVLEFSNDTRNRK